MIFIINNKALLYITAAEMNATATAHSDMRDMSQGDDLMQHILSHLKYNANNQHLTTIPEDLTQEVGEVISM
jgi:hypothetical protein